MRKKKSKTAFLLLVSMLVFSCLFNGLFGYYFLSAKIKKKYPPKEVLVKGPVVSNDVDPQAENIKIPSKRMKNPLVIVVGCITYHTKEEADLPGTKIELEKITRLFEDVYRYKVVSTYVKDRPETWKQNRKSIVDFCKKQQAYLKENSDKHDGVFFVYSGHGHSGTILASDGKNIGLSKIKAMFDLEGLPEMVDKPKIFLFSKCRGQDVVEAVKIGGALHHPEEDFIEIYSNIEDYQIKDNPPDGGFLIHEFTDWLTHVSILRKLDLVDFFKIINNNVQHTSKHTELVVQHVKAGYKITLEPNDENQEEDVIPQNQRK